MTTPTPPLVPATDSPVGPPACEGYQAVATDGGYLHVARVHCPGCAESASLRERLATAERHKAELMERNANLHAAKEAALALTKGEALSVTRAAHDWEQRRAVAAEAERDELRGRLKATEEKRDWWHRLHGDATLALQAARAELDGNLAKRDAYLARLTEDDGRARPAAIPEGTPIDRK